MVRIDGQSIELSHIDKIIYPRDGITKGDIIAYYEKIAPIMVPLIEHRCVSMQRFVKDIDAESFYHKEVPDYFPDFVDRYRVPLLGKEGKTFNTLVVCNSAATLVYLANQDCLTLHTWLSKISRINKPDKLIFDLDPSDNSFEKVVTIAIELKEVLMQYNIPSFVMVTGSRGVHVVVPLQAAFFFDDVRDFAKKIAQQVVARNSRIATLAFRKEDRARKVFIDITRNAYGQTSVAPYALRAKDGAPIAMPITWQELESSYMHASFFTLEQFFKNMDTHEGDYTCAWHNFDQSAIMLPQDV